MRVHQDIIREDQAPIFLIASDAVDSGGGMEDHMGPSMGKNRFYLVKIGQLTERSREKDKVIVALIPQLFRQSRPD
jgi:hypothetical protein